MVATDSFMDFPENILAFPKSNTLHEDAGGGAFVQVVANKDETFTSSDDARCFSAFGFDIRWSLNSLMKSMNCIRQSSSIIITSLTVAEASASVIC